MITESKATRKPCEMYCTSVDEPFKCGFDPTKHNFRQYVFHIEGCPVRRLQAPLGKPPDPQARTLWEVTARSKGT
jgi:hypothetical protein